MSDLRRIRKSLKQRDDVLPEGHAPKEVQLALVRAGGLNPHGEPRYRLVLAQCVYEWHGGKFYDWPKGLSLQEQGGLVFSGTTRKTHRIKLPEFTKPISFTADVPMLAPSTQRPVRTFEGMRYVKKYPTIKGWVLQIWRPPSHFARATWEAMLYRGNPEIPMLGPFPAKGAYEIRGEAVERDGRGVFIRHDSFKEVPAISMLEDMIQFFECDHLKTYGANPETRVAIRLQQYQTRMQQIEEQQRDEQLNYIRNVMKPIMASSLEGGRLRSALAKRAGITEHVGN